MSADEPSDLLQHLSIDNSVETPVGMRDMSSTDMQQQTASDTTQTESSEATSNAAAELESYYVYVLEEEPSTVDHSDHVNDLLARYTQQEGSNFETEFGACAYVSVGTIYLPLKNFAA